MPQDPPPTAPPVATPAAGGAPGLGRGLTVLFAIACGLAVSTVYAAQPLLDRIATDLGVDRGAVGIVVTVTQLAYGAALVLVVPLVDRVGPRRLAVAQAGVLAVGTAGAALAPGPVVLLVALATVGAAAVLTQVLVASAATLSAPADRGRAVGTVTSGVVVGILLSRTVAGGVADAAGWRAVYVGAAVLAALVAVALHRAMPTVRRPAPTASYARLVASVGGLVRREPVLRRRALLAFLTFGAFSTVWTSLALPLTDRAQPLTTAQIGLFGLAGLAGAAAAGSAGRWADRGLGPRVTGVGLAILVLSWGPIGLLDDHLAWLVLGLVLLDGAVQAVHVSSQAALLGVAPDAAGRLTAAYMACYSLGSATGAVASTALYGRFGWPAVCVLGAAFSAAGLAAWARAARSEARDVAVDRAGAERLQG